MMIPPPFLLTNRFRRYRGIELIATDTRKSLPRTSNRAGVVHKGGCLGTIVTAPQYTIVREVLLLLDDDGSSSSFSPPMSTIPIYIRGRRVLVESIRPGSGRTGKGPLVVARSNEVAVTTTAINWTISELFVLLSRVELVPMGNKSTCATNPNGPFKKIFLRFDDVPRSRVGRVNGSLFPASPLGEQVLSLSLSHQPKPGFFWIYRSKKAAYTFGYSRGCQLAVANKNRKLLLLYLVWCGDVYLGTYDHCNDASFNLFFVWLWKIKSQRLPSTRNRDPFLHDWLHPRVNTLNFVMGSSTFQTCTC